MQDLVQADDTSMVATAIEERIKRWDLLLGSHLLKLYPKTRYTLLSAKAALGMATFVYVKKDVGFMISDASSAKANTATASSATRQGAVILRYAALS